MIVTRKLLVSLSGTVGHAAGSEFEYRSAVVRTYLTALAKGNGHTMGKT